MIKDHWMDNIDWVQIKRTGGNTKRGSDEAGLGDSSSDDEPEAIDKINIYKEMIALMKPGETVAKSLRRLGGGKAGISAASASQRWKTKRAKSTEGQENKEEDEQKQAEEAQRKADMLQLTGHADKLLQHGNLEIYQDSFEKLSFLIKTAEEKVTATRVAIPAGTDTDDALDMFADDLDQKQTEKDENMSSTATERLENGSKVGTASSASANSGSGGENRNQSYISCM